jgi:hypothetical protein
MVVLKAGVLIGIGIGKIETGSYGSWMTGETGKSRKREDDTLEEPPT